ncbi:hypothetical protein B481_0004 [Planococcus halocryophilus Or1]|nr:hypothetical protein B481_0004 [Planococcus halocryophilus Or1]
MITTKDDHKYSIEKQLTMSKKALKKYRKSTSHLMKALLD